ncbi:MAG: hypothetical protein GY716_12980 [bacterium]|nr:hypothetical protein [bacterium]
MRKNLGPLLVALAVLSGAAHSTAIAQDSFSFEDDLEALTLAVTRLVDATEARVRAESVDRDLGKLRVAVSVLEIRTRRYESLQRQLDNLKEKQSSTERYRVSVEGKLENVRRRLVETANTDEAEGWRMEQDDHQITLQSLDSRLEHNRTRQLEVQNRLLSQEQHVREVEDLIDDWMSELQLGESKKK